MRSRKLQLSKPNRPATFNQQPAIGAEFFNHEGHEGREDEVGLLKSGKGTGFNHG